MARSNSRSKLVGISQMNLQPLGLTQGGDDNANFTTTPWTELKEEKN